MNPKQFDPRAGIQQGPPEYQPRILQHPQPVAPNPACFPGPDFQPRCRENKTILLSRPVYRAPARPELQGRSTQSRLAPGAASPTGSDRRARGPRKPREPRDLGSSAPIPASVSLPRPPAGGLCGASRLWSSRPLNTHPSAVRLSAPLTLEGGRSRDAHHRGAQPVASAARFDPPQAQAGTCTRRTRPHQRRRRHCRRRR